jgi:hypothetical protein
MNWLGENTVRHGLVLVLPNVGIIRVAVCGERRLCPLFEGLLDGTERWFWAWNA